MASLESIPLDILNIIILGLDAFSLIKLAQTNKFFLNLCCKEDLWKKLYEIDFVSKLDNETNCL